MKKIIFIISLILLTGCSAEYNLNIDGSNVREVIKGNVTNKELDSSIDRADTNIYTYYLESATPLINDEGEYTKKVTDKKDRKEFEYSYTFDNNYKDSAVLNTCFNNPIITEDDNFYYYKASGDFNCQVTDKVKVNITSTYAVIDSNADKVVGNTYTWILKNNKADISFTIAKDVVYEEGKYQFSFGTFKVIGAIVLIVLSIITYMLYKKKNSND